MKKICKNLLISIGPGYHHQVRLMHHMVKDKSDSSILFFDIDKGIDHIGDDLRFHYSSEFAQFTNTFGKLREWFQQEQFDLIGVSFMSHYWEIFTEISRIAKEVLPNCKVIAGGVHAWHIDSAATLEKCDYVCVGEGENLYSQLIDVLSEENPKVPHCIPGLMEKHDGKVTHTPAGKYMPIDDIPYPIYGSNKFYRLYSRQEDNPVFSNEDPIVNESAGYIHAGRGCSFRCTFCINSVIEDPSVRIRTPEVIIKEIKEMLAVCKDIKRIYFMDEIFPVRQYWLPEFCRQYKEQIGLPFQVTLYPGMLNEEKVAMLKDAGLREISMGVQSGSERIRAEIYHRRDKNERLTSENRILSKNNIMVYYDFIIRNPYETKADLIQALDMVHSLRKPYYLKFYTLAFYPNHPITIRALKEKMVDPKEVDATIGYLDVTTPHKVIMADHSMLEKRLLTWHNRIRKRMLAGMRDEAYYLTISYYGYWYIPRFILSILYHQVKRDQLWMLYIFSYLMEGVLIVRNVSVVRYTNLVIRLIQKSGFKYAFARIREKMIRILNPYFPSSMA